MKVHPTHKTEKGKPVQNWWYCRQCGLVYLKNAKTRQAMRAKCPDYEQ